MPALNRKLILEGFFILLLGLPFLPWLDPFPRYIQDMHLLYGNFGFVPIVEGFNNLFDTIFRSVVQVFSFGAPEDAGIGVLFFYIRNVCVYLVIVSIVGILLVFLTERIFSWKIPLAIGAWIVVSIIVFQISMVQESVLTSRRAAMNDQLGSLIQVSVQRCSLRAGELADQQIINCDLVVSNLPPNDKHSSLERPSIQVYYSHPKRAANSGCHRWPDNGFVSAETSDTFTLSADRTTATFQSGTSGDNVYFKPKDFYISAIQYDVGFDHYLSNSMHIPLKEAFGQKP